MNLLKKVSAIYYKVANISLLELTNKRIVHVLYTKTARIRIYT